MIDSLFLTYYSIVTGKYFMQFFVYSFLPIVSKKERGKGIKNSHLRNAVFRVWIWKRMTIVEVCCGYRCANAEGRTPQTNVLG